MDSSPPLETVYQAVLALYHNPDPSEKEKASLWLGDLQRSVFAWKVADEMLHHKRDLESCYFAAQTMRTKIQLSFHELPPEAHTSLRDSLMEHIGQVNDATNTVIVTQLCLALADLALQTSTWQKPVLDLITKFSGLNIWPLLEILTVLPEEVNSRSLRLGANRRQEVLQDLTATASAVNQFLVSALSSVLVFVDDVHPGRQPSNLDSPHPISYTIKLCLSGGGENPQIHVRILRCFTSWVSIQAITLADVAENIVVGHAFLILTNSQVSPCPVSFSPTVRRVLVASHSHQQSGESVSCLILTNSQSGEPMSRLILTNSQVSPCPVSFSPTGRRVRVSSHSHQQSGESLSRLILTNSHAVSGIHEAATDCVCALLQCLEDNNNQQALELQLFSGVMTLEESFHMSVAHEDQEKSMNYCRIFTELAESFLEKIVNGSSINKPHFAVKILDVVLTCVGHHDYEDVRCASLSLGNSSHPRLSALSCSQVAEITFNLWYRLSEELYQKNNDSLTSLFKPYVERLIQALCRHCQMEPDHEGLLEDGDDFADFRLKVSELIKDMVFIVGSSNCFRQMFLSLQTPGVTWDSSEAALFVMQAVAKNILPEENDVVPKVVEAILNLPENTHVAVRHTSVLLLGELCEWIEKHPQSLEPVLNFLLYCLQQPKMASVSANSLQSICSACRDHMAVHFSGLVQIIQSLDTFSISNEAAIGLLKGVSVILGRMPTDQIQQAMKEICWIQITPLCQLVENDVKTEKGTKSDPALWLDRLAAIFRHTNVGVENGQIHPCQGVITELWPVLSNTCTKFQSDHRVMERCCRCLRFAVRCVGKQSAHLLEPLVKQVTQHFHCQRIGQYLVIVNLYQLHQHSCFLYLGSILVDEYASEPGCAQGLLDMMQAFIGPTFIVLQEANGLKNHPDTVDDLFRLCARYLRRFIQRSPVAFLQSAALTPIIQCGLLACTLDHRDANASVMKFFFDLIHCGRIHEEREDHELRQKLVGNIIQENGQALVNNLVQACVFCLHSYMLTDVADVFMALMQHNRAVGSPQIWSRGRYAAQQGGRFPSDLAERELCSITGRSGREGAMQHNRVVGSPQIWPRGRYAAQQGGRFSSDLAERALCSTTGRPGEHGADLVLFCLSQDLSQWLEIAIKALPTQNSGGSITATPKQLVDFHSSLTRAEGNKAAMHALRDFARLFR
uniref:(California timema) hypothetical protein n=1 Tax=Timema californicum TaxID=61474 RepID=A0A7R9P7I8_TIMCA|nr:unnamed protein product [Timema californicum]